nr:excisionase [Escherichia coli]
MAHDVPLGCAPDEYDDLISGTCSHLPLTLQEWNARQRRPRSLETVRRWVRECRIFPPPVKDGREYLFHESAVKVDLNRPVTGSLLKRIRNGKKAKS